MCRFPNYEVGEVFERRLSIHKDRLAIDFERAIDNSKGPKSKCMRILKACN